MQTPHQGHQESAGHGHGHHGPTHDHGHRHVGEDMLSVEDAHQQIMACFAPLEVEEKPILDCLGQTLAAEVRSPLALPPLANSGMDGYAVRREDIVGASETSPRNLRVIGLVAAGQVSDQTVEPGTAIRIMTGAPVPSGADTVVPFEETDEIGRRTSGRSLADIDIQADLPLGCNVRPAGEDVREGDLVLEAGTVVRSAEIGVMASLGLEMARVIRRPLVSVLSTGDELASLGEQLAGGKIYDSNSFSVAASVMAAGGIPKVLGIARDNLEDMHRKLEEVANSDLLVTSAGVSKGDYDVVKDVLTERGDINFWSVRMRPAKPLAFGMLRGDPVNGTGKPVPLMGLPGNPVSAMVAFEMFGRPAIRTMLGRKRLARPTVEGVLTAPIYNSDGRRVYARVEVEKRDGIYYANPTGPQGSNILTSMSRANALAICPDHISYKDAGEKVDIIMLDWNEEVDYMTIPNPDVPQQEEDNPSYHVSFDRLDQLNRSAITLLAARRPAMVPSMLKEDNELDNPQEILSEIAEFCGSEEDFIDSGMPLQEIIFRTLLARRNEPMALNDLHDELTQRWSTPVRPINLTLRTLERILNSDNYYGFARVED